ncbi:MAG: PQQ-binding-like beta-propeller repeat protein [Planctomycetota bacterium]
MNHRTMGRFYSIIGACIVGILLTGTGDARDWSSGRADSQGTGATEESLPKDLDLLWEVELEGIGFDATPIIVRDMVYANDYDGRIFALKLDSGKEVWRKELDTEFVAAPTFKDGRLYVADAFGSVMALDPASGDEIWSYKGGAGEIKGGPVLYRDSLMFTSESGTLSKLSTKDGTLEWQYKTDAPILCSASLAGDITFLGGCDEYLHVVDVETGKRIGDPVQIGQTQSTPAVAGSSVLIPVHSGDIFKFDINKERQLDLDWQVKDDKISDEFRNSLAVKDGIAVGSGRTKRVFAINIEDGEVLWSSRLRAQAEASPIIAGDSVFVAASDGRVVRFDLKTGEETWMFEVKRGFVAPPAAANGKLVVANDRGTIFCFGEKSGK